jgi:hypothetical protein
LKIKITCNTSLLITPKSLLKNVIIEAEHAPSRYLTVNEVRFPSLAFFWKRGAVL